VPQAVWPTYTLSSSLGRGRPVAKYTLDTNLYIDATRDSGAAAALEAFLDRFAPETYLSAIVMQELRAGARTQTQADVLEADIFDRFVRVNRCVGPSVAAFVECGRVLADLWRVDGVRFNDRPRSLVNDILLATSCREEGITLVTADADFGTIARHLKGFRHVQPFPD
jgi:predicted nucleic acid-binding protein